ncbi:MAG: cyclic nucleotide-binding domain-containing protein [Alkalispirochaeta sp.]
MRDSDDASKSEAGLRPVGHLVEFLREVPLFSNLDVETVEYLVERLRPFEVTSGTRLIRQGEEGDALYLLSSGRLEAVDETQDRVLGEITPGEIVGETALLTDEPRGATVRAVSDSRGYVLEKKEFLNLLQRYPQELQSVAELITRRAAGLTREQYRPTHEDIVAFLRGVDLFSSLSDTVLGELAPHLQWFTLPRGETLLRQGEPGDQLYAVVSGRLRFDVRDASGQTVQSGTIHRGDVVGELSILTEEVRSATVTAVRDCGLLTLTARTMNLLMNRYPQVVLGLTRILALRLQSRVRPDRGLHAETIAIIPIHPGISPVDFVERLRLGFPQERAVRTVHQQDTPAASSEARLRDWLNRVEDDHEHVLLVGEMGDDSWNDLCRRHADRLLLLIDPLESPDLTRFELRHLGTRATTEAELRELVFCRVANRDLPVGSIAEFRARRFHTRYHHVRHGFDQDIRRVARFVAGSAVGLALGGGGARGLAHIGAVRAIREVGIPIDLVVGTSIGSLVGAVVALELTHEEMKAAAWKKLVTEKPFRDPGLPLTALLRGKRMTSGLRSFFGERRIEELPVPYAAVATDLAARDLAIMDQGPVWKAVRSSASLPGLLPPVYDNGRLLVDGGLLDNAPGDVARTFGVGSTILLDVSGNVQGAGDGYRAAYSGVEPGSAPGLRAFLRLRRRRRRDSHPEGERWPGIGETLMDAMIVGSARHGREAGSRADHYLRLPVDDYTMLGFEAVEELADLGYEITSQVVGEWAGSLPTV